MATTTHVSRRSLFTAAAATLAGTAVAALPLVAKADPHADAELVRLWAEYAPLSRYINTAPGLSDETVNELCEQAADIEYAIQDTPAHTLLGLAVKAKLARQYAPSPDPERYGVEDILMNLLGDVLRLAAIAFPDEVVALPDHPLVNATA